VKTRARTRLIEARKQRQWSQQELATLVGTTQHNVSRWEGGRTTPGPYFRARLCELFGMCARELGLMGTQEGEEAQAFPASLSEDVQASLLPADHSIPLWHVPYARNPFFSGRDEVLLHLHDMLHREHTMALTQSLAISGLGGIGKTQIALEYAYRYRQEYSALFWTSAASRETLFAGLLSIATILHLPEQNEQDYSKVTQVVKRWLATHQRWLLILDNVEDVTIVQDIAPPEQCGHLLLTTRAQALGSLAQRLDVETMGVAESALLLLRRAKLLTPESSLDQAPQEYLASAEAIAIEMDFLPLALDQAGAYIEEVGCSLTAYLDLYRKHRTTLLQRRGQIPTDHPESVVTTWSLSFQRIEQTYPAATNLLRLLAFLEPDTIPEELVHEGSMVPGQTQQEAANDELMLDKAIGELRKFSLVQRNPETRLLRVHRLVQAVLREAMETHEQQRWAEQAVRTTHRVFPETVEMTTWPQCQRYLPQAQECSRWIKEYNFRFAEAAALLLRTAQYLQQTTLYEQAESLCQLAIHIQQHVFGSEHPSTALFYSELAIIYKDQGKYQQAEPLYQRVLHIQEQALGAEHPNIGLLLNGLANLFFRQGKYGRAELFYQRALHILEQGFGPEHPAVAHSLNGLAILAGVQHKFEQAEPLYQRALYIWEQALGPLHPDVARPLNNLAILFFTQGKYEQAEPLYQRALHIWEQAFGPGHPNVAHPLHNLAELYAKQRKYEQAKPLYQRALHIWEQAYGSENPHAAYPLHGLATLASRQGKFEQAELLYHRALHIREQALGLKHPDTAETLHEFATMREAQGNVQEAEALYQRALAIREQILGPSHPETMKTRTSLYAVLQVIRQRDG
jgi:tetratricopeptide (TPR) repeat protein/transcriptional regulator with XRE-family HTH domain